MAFRRVLAVLLSACLVVSTPAQVSADNAILLSESTETVSGSDETTVSEDEEEIIVSENDEEIIEEGVEETVSEGNDTADETISENVEEEEELPADTEEEPEDITVPSEEEVTETIDYNASSTALATVTVEDANYTLTVSVYEDTLPYAVVTGYADAGLSNAYPVTIPATVDYDGTAVNVTEITKEVFVDAAKINAVHFAEDSVVTSIGYQAFKNCVSLADIELPNGLLTLGEYAFYGCTSLTQITIPKTLTTVTKYGSDCDGPFTGCSNLTDITIEEGMTAIPGYLFEGTIVAGETDDAGNYIHTFKITIPDSVETIGDGVFSNNSTLTDINFGENSKLTTIGAYAFSDCTELTYINLPDTVTTIARNVFMNCTSLGTKDQYGNAMEVAEVKLPAGLEKLGEYAFQNCTSLVKITIPKTLTTITQYGSDCDGPFNGCSNLTEVTLEEGTTAIPGYLFEGTIVTGETDVSGNYVNSFKITIPDSVETIGEGAFSNNSTLTEITFGESSKLTTIGEYAFSDCAELTYIDIPDTVTTISRNAFMDCTNLGTKDKDGNVLDVGEVVLPSKLETLGEYAFENCISLEKVVIPKALTSVKGYGTNCEGPFRGCSNLTDITFESGITSIPAHLFEGPIATVEKDGNGAYIKTMSFDIPDSVETIGEGAFKGLENMAEVNISDNSKLTSIGKSAFSGCSLMSEIHLPKNLTTIGQSSFYNCASLESLFIPETVTKIDKQAFQGCAALKTVEFEVNNFYTEEQKIGEEVFEGCTSLEKAKLGNKIKTLSKGTFSGCSSLLELEIPYGVTTIGTNVFYNCTALKALFIPSSVTKISTTKDELAYCYEQGLKIYVEKGESHATTFATENGFTTEVGIYVTKDEFPDTKLWEQMSKKLYDKNLDTRLTIRELEQIIDVDLSGVGIKDMTGTQLFTSMEKLNCSNNEIAVLDTTTWSKLKELNCSDNLITNLDVSKTPIEKLNCNNNSILVFDLSAVKTLRDVSMGDQEGTLALKYDETYKEYILPLKESYSIYNKSQMSDVSDEDAGKPTAEGLTWYEAYDVPDYLTYTYSTGYGNGDATASAVVKVIIPNAGIVLTDKEYPDAAFRTKVQELVDINKNGLISKTEERTHEVLDVNYSNIVDMTGIERLPNLKELNCSGNLLTNLDISKNPKLESLLCANNKLSKLDLTANILLTTVECGSNRLAALDVSANTELENLRAGSQEVSVLKEKSNDKYMVALKEYDDVFDKNLISNVITYTEEGENTSGDYITIEDEGFIVDTAVNRIAYQYRLDGFRPMEVVVKLVDELDKDSININDLQINDFSDKVYTGEATTQNIVIMDAEYMLREGYDYTVTYSNNIEIGIATVIISGKNNYYGSYKAQYEIKPQWNITVKNIPNQEFQNKEIKPTLSVKLGKQPLMKNSDYKVDYFNNIETGVATVVITGTGKYENAGMKEVNFNIVECNIKKATFAFESVTYNKAALEPAVTAKYNGTLTEGKDYIVSYSKNTKAGKGTATITGIGDFTGTVKKTFVINKINLEKLSSEDIVVDEKVGYNASGAKAKVMIKCGDIVLEEGVDYTLSYSKNKAIGKGAKVLIKGKGSCTGKIPKEFEITPQEISDESINIKIDVVQKDKNGNAVKPKVTITQNKKQLKEGENKDFTLEYDKDATINSGEVKLVIHGHGKYQGSYETTFVVVDKVITKAKIKGLQNFEYDGGEIEQDVDLITVMLGNEVIPLEYCEITYDNNFNVGKATIMVTVDPKLCESKYEYGGTATGKFTIKAVKFKPSRNEQRVSAILLENDLTYAGEALYPEEVVYDETLGTTLVNGVDYKVTYKNNVKVNNKGTVTIKGMGNYSGSLKLTFRVTPKNMAETSRDFEVYVKHSAYTGKNIKPRITVKDGDTTLKLNKDYRINIDTVKEKGIYAFTIDGMGNYTGQLEEEYYLYVY